jgi:hypothetical protein
LLELYQSNQSLESIKIDQFPDGCIHDILLLMKKNSTLKEFNIFVNGESTAAFVEFCHHNSTIEKMHVEGNWSSRKNGIFKLELERLPSNLQCLTLRNCFRSGLVETALDQLFCLNLWRDLK